MSESDKFTRVVRRGIADTPTSPISQGQKSPVATPKTEIYRPRPATKEEEDSGNAMITGWLIITSGPGKGKFFPLGYGVNVLGRSTNCAVCINEGDNEIARESQADIIYDKKGKKFYIRHGEGVNLTYLNDAPVLQPVKIKSHDKISIGKTTLLLIPLCGAAFSWEEQG